MSHLPNRNRGGRALVRFPDDGWRTLCPPEVLPLRNSPCDVFPAPAEIRVALGGSPLGPPLRGGSHGLNGVYPNDGYEMVVGGPDSAGIQVRSKSQ